MKSISKKLERIFTAVAFAEVGEFDTARVFLRNNEMPQKVQLIHPDIRNRKAPRIPRR